MNRSSAPPPFADLALRCHPASPWQPPYALTATIGMACHPVDTTAAPGLLLDYRIGGALADLRLPEPTPPGPADGLWRHTCLEAFVSSPGEAAYREFNFSPSGQWAAYRFQAERERDTADTGCPGLAANIRLKLDHQANQLQVQAWVPVDLLPPTGAQRTLLWGLCAVLEHHDGRLSYWALSHPRPAPDFHHPAGRQRALHLPAPSSAP